MRFLTDLFVLKIMPLFNAKTLMTIMGLNKKLTFEEKEAAYRILKFNPCIVLTYEKAKLSTLLIDMSSAALRKANPFLSKEPHMGNYSHVSGSVPPEMAGSELPIVMVESVSDGVIKADFFEVFNVNAATILMPKYCSKEAWLFACERACANIGKKYDTMFNPSDDYYSCAELWIDAIKFIPDWKQKFKGLAEIVNSGKNITPEMFILCGDFHIVYNVRH